MRGTLAAILVTALLIRLALFFGGIRGSDAYLYSEHAWDIASGRYSVLVNTYGLGTSGPEQSDLVPAQVAPAMAALRFGVLLPTALAYRMFGVGDLSAAFAPLLMSLLTILMVALIGRRLADAPTGLWAAALAAVYPLDIQLASLLGPDSFIPALSAAAFLAFILGQDRLNGGDRRQAFVFFVAAGAAVGALASLRETGVLMLLPFALFIVWWRALNAAHGGVLVGLATVAASEAIALALTTGVPFYRYQIAALFGRLLTDSPPEVTSFVYYPKAILGLDLAGVARYGLFFPLAVAAFFLHRRLGGRWGLPAVWLIAVFAVLNFGSVSLTRYVPIIKSYAYLSFVTVPVVLLAGFVMRDLQRVSRGACVAVAAVIVVTSLYGTARVLANVGNDAAPYQRVVEAVAQHPDRPIYLHHPRWALFLNYFLRYQTGFRFVTDDAAPTGRLRYVGSISDPGMIHDAWVVAHERYLVYDIWGRYVGRASGVPDFLVHPPSGWQVLLTYRGHPGYNTVTLYYAPAGRVALEP